MRICPKCNRRFPDNTLFCPDDGKALVSRVDDKNAAPELVAGGPEIEVLDTLDERPQVDLGSAPQRNPNRQPSPTPTRREAPPSYSGGAPSTGHNGGARSSSNSPSKSPTITEEPFNPNDLIGQSLFGEYTITRKLGEGGMGAVYLAQQDSIDQRIAVKVLHEHAAEDDELIQRFHREAQVVSMLTHPNIIRVFIFGRTQGGLLYLAMEFVEGESLRDLLDKGILDELRAIKIMKQLCSGLSEAHDLGIIHRDLKPENVLLTNFRGEENFVKILDFGIAKLNESEGEEQQKLTQAGIVYGTPEYLSPEQAQAHELDNRTDLYSLGVMLYEFMTGVVPFQDAAPVQVLTAHVFTDPKPPSQVAPDRVTPTMEKIILKAMAKKTDDRFQNAMEMFEALVAREQELVREQGLTGRAAYVPGMELTGMYTALDFSNAEADAEAAVAAQPALDDDDPTQAMQGPPQAAIEEARRRAGANPTMQSKTSPPTTTTPSEDSSTRTIIYVLIAVTAVVFLTLVLVIAYLVFIQ